MATHPTADEASPQELRRATVRQLLSLVVLALLVVPLLRDLPLGETTRTGLLAWLLVAVALYWLWAGQGYRGLLLLQLAVFSAAAALLSGKALLVGVGVHRFAILRRTAHALIVAGAALAAVNFVAMLVAAEHGRHRPRGAG